MVGLTKQQTLEEHRKMWNWIAEQYEKGCKSSVHELKLDYAVKTGCEAMLLHDCFCCQYAYENSKWEHRCTKCPVIWGTEMYCEMFFCEYPLSAYEQLKNESDDIDESNVNSEKCARLAREIANLPEKGCV